jgi:hypothetical protein
MSAAISDQNIDPATGKPRRRSLADMAQSGQYPGAVPSLASLLPTGSDAPFTDANIDPSKPYLGSQRQAPAYSPQPGPLASAASVMPNATGGQAQLRASDNAIAATPVAQMGPPESLAGPSKQQGANVDLAGANARMAAGLAASANIGTQPGGALEPGYRGPQAPGSSAPGVNNMDEFLRSNALARVGDRMVRQSPALAAQRDTAALAQAAGLDKSIAERQALERNDAGFANANAGTLANATAGELGARGASLTAMTPALKERALADALQARAHAGQAGAQTGLLGAQTEEAQQKITQQKQLTDLSAQFIAETDPAKQAVIGNKLLIASGKKPEEYTVHHAAGGTDPNDPTGMRKLSDNIVIVDKASGKAQVVPLGQNKPPNPGEAMDAIKSAKGDEAKIAAIKARYLSTGGDPALLK